MNKTSIKTFAIESRNRLIENIVIKAKHLGIEENQIIESESSSSDSFVLNGIIYNQEVKRQRDQLIHAIHLKGYKQVIEEVAYTWFNRFIALRYMEVNGYLPQMVKLFSNHENSFKPEILSQVLQLNWEYLDKELIYKYKEESREEDLYKYLLISECNEMNTYLPGIFEVINDYTELLFPDGLLKENSVLKLMVESIPEEDWKEQVEIIGWLYQYYNSEVKDETYALSKKNIKVTKERVPSVTQLFTPDWIVRYMVENSLGRLWVEGHPQDDRLKSEWKYYLEEAKQEESVELELKKIREEYSKIKVEEIKVIEIKTQNLIQNKVA